MVMEEIIFHEQRKQHREAALRSRPSGIGCQKYHGIAQKLLPLNEQQERCSEGRGMQVDSWYLYHEGHAFLRGKTLESDWCW